MAHDPGGVVWIVVISKLHQACRRNGPAQLGDVAGGQRLHPLRQWIDWLEVVDNDLRHPKSLGAGGIVVGVDSTQMASHRLRRGVGVQRQMEPIGSEIRLPDRGCDGAIRVISGDIDAGGQ